MKFWTNHESFFDRIDEVLESEAFLYEINKYLKIFVKYFPICIFTFYIFKSTYHNLKYTVIS